MKLFRLLIAAALLFGMNACTSVQVSPDGAGQDKNKSWEMRKQKLTKSSAWALSGRSSVLYREENWPFGIQWKQYSPQQYDVTILHPLTRNRIGLLKKVSGAVTFTDDKGRLYRDSNAENLLRKQLNIGIPIEGMQYWVRGLAAPQYPLSSFKLDAAGRPVSIQQAGWTIRYSSYSGRSYAALPGKVTISRSKPEALQVKMRIKSWGK